MTGVSGVKSRKLWQVMDWVTVTNHAAIEFVVLVNEKFWQSLSDEQRHIIAEAARYAEVAVREEMSRIETLAYETAKAEGMKVQLLSPEQIDAWRKATQPVLQGFLKDAGALGEQVVKAAQALRK